MDERDLEAEEAAPRHLVDELRAGGLELFERTDEIVGPDCDVVHPWAAPREKPTDRRVVARRRHELEDALAHEDCRCLDTLLDERLTASEPGAEQRLVRRDRLVEIGDGDAEMMYALHPRDAIRAS